MSATAYSRDHYGNVAEPRQVFGSHPRLEMRVRRGADHHDLSLTPVQACAYDVVLKHDDTSNAFADGEKLIVTTGMMDFVRNDQELALIVAHELAHNALGHSTAKIQNAVAGGIAGLLLDVAAAAAGVNTQGAFADVGAKAGARTYSVAFEQEADHAGVYFMARAGFPLDGAADFWRRMAVKDPRSIVLRTSHPTAPERFVALEQAVQEVVAKMTTGQALTPEKKPEPMFDSTASEQDEADR